MLLVLHWNSLERWRGFRKFENWVGERERERLKRAGMLYSNYRLFAEVVCLSDTNLHTCAHISPTHPHTHTHTRARAHTHTHTLTHIHTHTHNLSLSLSLSRHLFQAGALACFYWILFLQSHVKPHSWTFSCPSFQGKYRTKKVFRQRQQRTVLYMYTEASMTQKQAITQRKVSLRWWLTDRWKWVDV